MSTVLDEIVLGIKSRNPGASAEEVSEAVVRVIENDVLPAALRGMRMPEPASPAKQLRQKLFLQRVKARRREATQSRIAKTKQLVSELEYVRREFRRIDVDLSSYTQVAFFGDITNSLWRRTESANSISVMKDALLRKDGFPITDEKLVMERKKELSEPRMSLPLPKEVKEPEVFSIDKSVQVVIMTDPVFAKNLSVVEKAARAFALESQSKMDFSLSFHSVIAIPDWKKLVLDVRAEGLDFDEKMKLWDQFDARIRNEIRQRIENAEGAEKERLKELDKAFFTHFDLT